MKRLMMTLVAVGALAVTSVAAAGGGGGAALGASQLTVHNVFGLQTLELQHFVFAAAAGPSGSARGLFSYREIDDGTPFDAGGTISCMVVIGNDAWVGATIQRSSDPTVVGQGAWWHVTDNGHGPGAAADITTFLGIGSLSDTAAYCVDHPAYKHPFPIDRGDILVHG